MIHLSYLCVIMKRFIATLLAVIYLSVSSGMVMNMHYCMGKLSSVKLAVLPKATCACGKKMEKKKGCCKTETKIVKVEDAQQKSVIAAVSFPLALAAPVAELNLLQASFYNNSAELNPTVHAPPLLSGQDTYLRNCVFRI